MSEDTKPQEPQYADIKIVAAMSVPLVGWNPHWGVVTEALRPFGIPMRLAYGAYWNQSLSSLLEDCIDDNIDWVMCWDFDTMATFSHVDRLIGQFGQNPHIDALAALQCRRGPIETPLMSGPAPEVQITGAPIEAHSAHFGMTLLRLDALKKVPKPWFVGRPDENGSYRTLRRVDPDVGFWHRWREFGNTVYVDPLCRVGHLQAMVAEFDEEFKPRQIHVADWREKNRTLTEIGA